MDELDGDLSTRAACELVGLSRAGKYRAAQPQRLHYGPALPRPTHNALAPTERDQIIEVLTSAEFVDKAPVQVYYTLLERGCYLASPRTMYRVLAAADLLTERRSQARRPPRAVPHLHATGPCQVASWDITAFLGPRRGHYYYGFMMIDIFSRLMPAARAYPGPREEYVEGFITACIEGFAGVIPAMIHSDNGSAMIAGTVADLYDGWGSLGRCPGRVSRTTTRTPKRCSKPRNTARRIPVPLTPSRNRRNSSTTYATTTTTTTTIPD